MDGQGLFRERVPSFDGGFKRGIKPKGIGGNADLAAQIASMATRRSLKRDSPSGGGYPGAVDDMPPQMRTQRANTIAGFHTSELLCTYMCVATGAYMHMYMHNCCNSHTHTYVYTYLHILYVHAYMQLIYVHVL